MSGMGGWEWGTVASPGSGVRTGTATCQVEWALALEAIVCDVAAEPTIGVCRCKAPAMLT